jgi:superfamily II DNA or RNA helicase
MGWNSSRSRNLLFPRSSQTETHSDLLRGLSDFFAPRPQSATIDDRWRHQNEALEEFLRAKRGILEMATRTGKTRTALNIFRRLFQDGLTNSLIVTAEGVDLLHQWYSSVVQVTTSLPHRIRVLRHFGSYHDRQQFILSPVHSVLLVSRGRVDAVLRRLDENQLRQTLIVHDEVHGLGSPSNLASLDNLSESITYRLGLSATPEREYDTSGTAFIERNVGTVLFRFGLEKAIKRGILCEFDYFPLEYSLTIQDKSDMQAVYRRAAARADMDGTGSNSKTIAS